MIHICNVSRFFNVIILLQFLRLGNAQSAYILYRYQTVFINSLISLLPGLIIHLEVNR